MAKKRRSVRRPATKKTEEAGGAREVVKAPPVPDGRDIAEMRLDAQRKRQRAKAATDVAKELKKAADEADAGLLARIDDYNEGQGNLFDGQPVTAASKKAAAAAEKKEAAAKKKAAGKKKASRRTKPAASGVDAVPPPPQRKPATGPRALA